MEEEIKSDKWRVHLAIFIIAVFGLVGGSLLYLDSVSGVEPTVEVVAEPHILEGCINNTVSDSHVMVMEEIAGNTTVGSDTLSYPAMHLELLNCPVLRNGEPTSFEWNKEFARKCLGFWLSASNETISCTVPMNETWEVTYWYDCEYSGNCQEVESNVINEEVVAKNDY